MPENFVIPKSELDKVTEAVCQGIVASKASDSNFWGEQKQHNFQTDLYLKEIRESVKKMEEYMKVQNGRTSALEKTKSYMSGATKVFVVIIVPTIGYLSYLTINNTIILQKISQYLNL